MVDYTNCKIDKVSVHRVGNKTNNEELLLSKSVLDTSDEKLRELLLRFFLPPFTSNEFYSFTFNPLYNLASKMFDSLKEFHDNSVNIAKHLFEVSIHPQIKPGDVFVVYFSGISINESKVDAIGIFKSENKQSFLKLSTGQEDFELNYEEGINTEKLDKGCLIFNSDRESGFKICIVDKSNKSGEAQFWKDNFLMIRPCSDDFHNTKEFLNITRSFITKKFAEEFEATKADQIDLLNRSVEYFKSHDTFDKEDFEKEVFFHENIIESFRGFNELSRENNEMDLADNFQISAHAVKKQERVFKSVLKLDKNFHIYIHGSKELIEKGFDEEKNLSYYKVYFKEEQ